MTKRDRIGWPAALLITLAAASGLASAAPSDHLEPLTEHTWQWRDDSVALPAIDLSRLHWLVGSWVGEAFGQRFEEVWNPPSAGSMVGLFKLYGEEGLSFYELLDITRDASSVLMRVKHFNPDFSAWEAREDFIRFRLLHADDEEIHFSGLSFYRDGEQAMTGYIVMRDSNGTLSEQVLHYRRQSH